MLDNLRAITNLKSELDQLAERQQKITEGLSTVEIQVQGFQEAVGRLQQSLDSFSKQFQAKHHQLEQALSSLISLGAEFEKEVHGIHVLKSDMQKRISKEAEEQIAAVAKDFLEKASPYKNVDARSNEIVAQLHGLQQEMEKFKAISSTIQQKDFELVKFGKMLEQNDREKLDLMRKIDALERLMAAMKRGRERR